MKGHQTDGASGTCERQMHTEFWLGNLKEIKGHQTDGASGTCERQMHAEFW
jgi:hypothetical protein